MADDDRYKWLDEEAAERLLRGPVVNAHSSVRTGRHDVPDRDGSMYGGAHEGAADHARPAAATPSWARSGEDVGEEQLAALLATLVEEQTAVPAAFDAAGAAGAAAGVAAHEAELPGEAAALEAFRAARLAGGAAGAAAGAVTAAAASAGHDEHVLTGGRPAREKRRLFGGISWGLARPLRAGFAMAVAGVALGGVAVAAGTGVIPVPFAGDREPAASVSPMVSPGTDDEQTSAGGSGSPSHSDSARPGSREGGTSSGSLDDDLAGTLKGQGGDEAEYPDGRELSEQEKRALARELCAKYEDGKLPSDTREQLEDAAGGAKKVKKFCAGHGGDGDARADGGPDGGGNKPSRPGGAQSGGTEGGDTGEATDGGAESGGDAESGGGGSRPDTSGGPETTDPTGTPTPSPTDPSTASATDSAESTAEDTAPSSADESLTPGE